MESSDEAEAATIHVRLLDEPIPVWRPVKAKALGDGRYLILAQDIPEYGEWEFAPGETVAVEAHAGPSGDYQKTIAVLK